MLKFKNDRWWGTNLGNTTGKVVAGEGKRKKFANTRKERRSREKEKGQEKKGRRKRRDKKVRETKRRGEDKEENGSADVRRVYW